VELVIKDTTDSRNVAFYLDLYLEHDINGTLTTKLKDNVAILTFLSSTIPFSTVTFRHLLHMVFTYRSSFDNREPVILVGIFYVDLSC